MTAATISSLPVPALSDGPDDPERARRLEWAKLLKRAFAVDVLTCGGCGGPLKPDVVLFGELLPQRALTRARELCESAEVLLCIGSSLEVHPVAALPRLTLEAGGAVAILTQGPTPYDDVAAVRLDGDVVSELERLQAALGAAI